MVGKGRGRHPGDGVQAFMVARGARVPSSDNRWGYKHIWSHWRAAIKAPTERYRSGYYALSLPTRKASNTPKETAIKTTEIATAVSISVSAAM